jgi:hypothetical protein
MVCRLWDPSRKEDSVGWAGAEVVSLLTLVVLGSLWNMA